MPHALGMPLSGFQAVILCGPGVSLNTFTSTADEFPKALVPIANRPMIWYSLDWCYRMGITSRCYLANLMPYFFCCITRRFAKFNYRSVPRRGCCMNAKAVSSSFTNDCKCR